jgi:hypothetical protein
MTDSSNDTVRLQLKVMQLLDCVAGNARTPDGPKIIILKLAHLDEIEQPMMFSIYDAQRLVWLLLFAMKDHGDDVARKLLRKYFPTVKFDPVDAYRPKRSGVDPNPLTPGLGNDAIFPQRALSGLPPTSSEPSPPHTSASSLQSEPTARSKPWTKRLTDRKTSLCKCAVQYGRSYRPRNSLFVLGGYTDGTSVFILARRRASNGGCEDGVAKLLPPGQINIWGDDSGDWLPDANWDAFLVLRKGKRFPINGKQWTKMDVGALAALTHGKAFKCIPRR